MELLLEEAARLDSRWVLAACLAALDVWSVAMLARSDGSRRAKVLWTGIIVFCPIVGCVLWYVLGPKPELGPAGGRS